MSSQDHITISSLPSENISENFDQLRAEGIEYLQKIAGKIWTDYNVHDPGVTILEVLCYAISDLGYRTNLDIKDLLAVNEEDSTEKDLNNFFTAREVLMNAPLTINDYRKLLIDVEGIKNAWFDKTTQSEIDFYVDKPAEELTYTPNAETTKIDLNGLYEVLLEFDESDRYGDLNDNTVVLEKKVKTGRLKGLQITVEAEFPYWSDDLGEGKTWESLEDIKTSLRAITVRLEDLPKDLEIEVEVAPDLSISATVRDTSTSPATDKPGFATRVLEAINGLFDPSGAGDKNLLVFQQKKVEETYRIVRKALSTVHANRNLCEDFVRFNALKIEEILLCADIEITPDADTEEVLAEIYFQIGQFLAPDINFYSIGELLEKGKAIEEIFQGPRLDHGFIDDDELENSSRTTRIHVSDLINIIMDIEGVIAVKKIEIANLPLGDDSILSRSVLWCLELAWEKNFVPRLTPEKSKVVFLKKGIPFIAQKDEVMELLEDKKRADRIQSRMIPELDLPVPNGQYFRLAEYTSIQEEFPENYGIGNIGLPKSASDLRKGQANQLKGFLLFFDQFLANYCEQLSHLKELFSMNSDIDQTYFHQSLFAIPNVQTLYTNFNHAAQLSNDPTNDKSEWVKKAWNEYVEGDIKEEEKECVPTEPVEEELVTEEEESNLRSDFTPHRDTLRKIIEDDETFAKRRNQFLDHLLARFSEQFTDYAMLAYKLEGKKANRELITDKLSFLQEYPTLSYGRGQAFNYKVNSWNSENVSGLEKRIARLLGIDSYSRRDLGCPGIDDGFEKYKDAGDKWRFTVKNTANDVLLKSEAYNSLAARTTGIESVQINGVDRENYVLRTSHSCKYSYHLKAQNGEIIGNSGAFASEAVRNRRLDNLIHQLNGECTGEGLYLVEHILLRPRDHADHFLPVNFDPDCYCDGNEDAYSFRATCVLPYWIGRFANMDFRQFVERTIREEAPAHVFMKVCWVDNEQMNTFQTAYRSWLSELENDPVDQASLTEKQNHLIAVLSELRNVYPVSNLYDCQESENSPMRLDQSILGTFTPKENE